MRVTTEPVKFIRPVNITEVGHLTRITGRAFTAGVLPVKVTLIANLMCRIVTVCIIKSGKATIIRKLFSR